jgi:hypothetical protein
MGIFLKFRPLISITYKAKEYFNRKSINTVRNIICSSNRRCTLSIYNFHTTTGMNNIIS